MSRPSRLLEFFCLHEDDRGRWDKKRRRDAMDRGIRNSPVPFDPTAPKQTLTIPTGTDVPGSYQDLGASPNGRPMDVIQDLPWSSLTDIERRRLASATDPGSL
jgi:hypothetical protein